MSLDAFGGVLVNSPGGLTVQPLLAPPSNFMTQTAYIPGPPTEITLDEDDVFQCGKCKKVFTSFQLFMFHKKEHQLSSSGSKFFGVGLTLALNEELGGNLNNVGLVDQGVSLRGNAVPQLVQNDCCQELPLPVHMKECLNSGSQQVSTDVLEYDTLGESAFDELHSDISQPMMLGDSDSLSFSIEQNALSISNADQLPESGYVSSSISDIQSTILQDKLIQHEDCETSCDHVWHLSQKDDSSSLNFTSSGFAHEQQLFLNGKKFSVTSEQKITQSIEYSNDGLLPEDSYSSDKEVFINDSSSMNVQEVMAESESQGILPSGDFFSKNSIDYMSNSDLLTEFGKVAEHSLVDNQIGESVTVLEVEMPLLENGQLQTSLMDSAVLQSEIPALMPIGEEVLEEACHSLKRRVLQETIIAQKACCAQDTRMNQNSIISPVVSAEEILIQGEPITKQIVSIMEDISIDKSNQVNVHQTHSKERKDKICKKRGARSEGKFGSILESTTCSLNMSSDTEELSKRQMRSTRNLQHNDSCDQKSKQKSSTSKRARGVKNKKNQKSVKVSSIMPLSPSSGSDSCVSTIAIPLETVLPSSGSSQKDSASNRRTKESSWEPRTLKLTCEFCNKKFAKQFDLQQHKRSHTGEKPFQCIVCGRAFAQKSNVTKHIRTHKVWPKDMLTLPKNFLQKVESNKKTGMDCDQNIDIDDDKIDEGKVVVRAKHNRAAKGFSKGVYVSDEQLSQKDKKMKKKNNQTEDINEIIIDNSYMCQLCNASFGSYFELKAHLKVHQDEKVYFCYQKECKQTFPDLESFVDHVQLHDSQEATYRCHICKETFKSLADLGTHQYSHPSYEKPILKRSAWKCMECKSRFKSPEALEHHMKTANHKHPCPECKREFPCERNLRRHLTTHSTALPFVCKECGKGFKTEGYLNVHLTMHSKDRPFACSQCPARFTRKDRLSRHFLIHQESKQLKCPFHLHLNCHRVFSRRDKLKAHVLSHTEHKHVDCVMCNRELVKYSENMKYRKKTKTVASEEYAQSSLEESQEFSNDVIVTDQDESRESPSSVESFSGDYPEDMFDATTETCEDDNEIHSRSFLSTENLPTIEIIVMPLPLSIS